MNPTKTAQAPRPLRRELAVTARWLRELRASAGPPVRGAHVATVPRGT